MGESNARHKRWYTTSNTRGMAVIKFGRETNARISVPPEPSYRTNGRQGHSNPDLMLDWEQVGKTKSRSDIWSWSSDHTPLLYIVRNAKLIVDNRRVSKAMIHNLRNLEEAGEWYRRTIPPLLEIIKQVQNETAQEA